MVLALERNKPSAGNASGQRPASLDRTNKVAAHVHHECLRGDLGE